MAVLSEHDNQVTELVSPGGYVFSCFGPQGVVYAAPIPTGITFFLDGSAVVCDQYGRLMKGVQTNDGRVVLFASSPPEANREGTIVPRPQFASHAEVVEALEAEGVNLLAHEVHYRDKGGKQHVTGGLSFDEANKIQAQRVKEGCTHVSVRRTVTCAGWPQLSCDRQRALKHLLPQEYPVEELLKIRDPERRKDCLRIYAEMAAGRDSEVARAREEAQRDLDEARAAVAAGKPNTNGAHANGTHAEAPAKAAKVRA